MENNKSIVKKVESDYYELSLLWSDDTFVVRINKSTNFSLFKDILLPKELSAIYHSDSKKLEFIYTPLKSSELFLERKTKFFYNGVEFQSEFSKPSEALELLAKGFQEIDNETATNYRNLRYFRDFYKKEHLSERGKLFFKDKSPYSFFLSGDFDKIGNDFINLSKHLNVHLKYYDRKAPIIVIHEEQVENEKYETPCLSKFDSFPESIVINKIDPVIVDLFHIANETANIRLKYIFYYQILEYCAYYHLNDDLKRKLNNILKNPDLIGNSSNYSRLIIEEFKNNFKNNDDKLKLEKVVIDFCSYNEIKYELKCNPKSFCSDIKFEGGFILESIMREESEIDNPSKDVIKKIVDRIDSLRNVMVHIRESRENKVILPTRKNNNQLYSYTFLLRRIAEIIAFKYEG
ncbi:MAG TPA: hypothetical protein VMV32_11305 [Ignavibacteriaceae bacterium]|nr:hypothetical protein [Ignavibacteriaceae bacterium]